MSKRKPRGLLLAWSVAVERPIETCRGGSEHETKLRTTWLHTASRDKCRPPVPSSHPTCGDRRQAVRERRAADAQFDLDARGRHGWTTDRFDTIAMGQPCEPTKLSARSIMERDRESQRQTQTRSENALGRQVGSQCTGWGEGRQWRRSKGRGSRSKGGGRKPAFFCTLDPSSLIVAPSHPTTVT